MKSEKEKDGSMKGKVDVRHYLRMCEKKWNLNALESNGLYRRQNDHYS